MCRPTQKNQLLKAISGPFALEQCFPKQEDLFNSEITHPDQLCTALFNHKGTNSGPSPQPLAAPFCSYQAFLLGFCPQGHLSLGESTGQGGVRAWKRRTWSVKPWD